MTNRLHIGNGLKTAAVFVFCLISAVATQAQEQLTIQQVLDSIERNNPVGKNVSRGDPVNG